jgi:hypothetical protein
LAGDVARLLREALGVVAVPVAMMSVTQPGEFNNETLAARWRRLDTRIRAELWREGLRPPRRVAWVRHRQKRGADHYHVFLLAGEGDQRERLTAWVDAYRRLSGRYGLGWVDDPLMPRHPKGPDGRPDTSRPKRNMVFADGRVAGAYATGYVTGGQFERALNATDHAGRGYWISGTLLQMSGWSRARCQWVRQGWVIAAGQWTRRGNWGQTFHPNWWHVPEDRHWVEIALGQLLPP